MEISFSKSTEAAPAPSIDVQAEVVKTTDTPHGVAVESTTVVNVAPAASIPTAPAAPAAPIQTAVAIVNPPGAVVASNPAELDDDNIGFEDVILPRINLVQKVGDLSNIFNPGEITLNQTVVIHEPAFIHPNDPAQNTPGTKPLIFTVLGFRKRQFTEKVEGGKLGLLLNTEADIVKNNGTLDYKEWQQSLEAAKLPGGAPAKKYFQRLATALLLVQRPEHIKDEDHVLFPYDCEGQYYALALWSMKGTAYTHAAKVLFTARKIGHLRTGYTAQGWSLTTKLEAFGSNFAYLPVIRPATKSTDAFRAFAKDVLIGGN